MRAIVQRVSQASVTINQEVYSQIGQGLLVLLAVHKDDQDKDLDYIVDKLVNIRIFSDDQGKLNRSIQDVDGEILIVSQFTLYGDARKGRRPSYSDSAKHEKATYYYEAIVKSLKEKIKVVETGVFAADMKVALINDGPVTIQLDSSKIY